jgi:hypothetical protein
MGNELNVSENRHSTVLCVGKFTRERRLMFVRNPALKIEYLERMKLRLLGLISRGYDSFLFCSWGYFDLLAVECLNELRSELSCDVSRLFPMAVLPSRDYEDDMPAPESYFQFVIYRDAEDIDLTEKEVASELLDNAAAVLFDNEAGDPLSADYAKRAGEMGMEIVGLTDAV